MVEYEHGTSEIIDTLETYQRDGHITSNLLMNYCVAISYVNSSVPLSTTLLERVHL